MPLIRVTVTIPPDLVHSADALARQRAASRSSVLSDALRAYLEAQHRPIERRRDRVAEPAGEYSASRLETLAAATDDALIAELSRRLGGTPVSRPASLEVRGDTPGLVIDQSRLAELCRRYRIRRLSLFGSVLRDDFRTDSDVDVLVEFESGCTPGLAIADIEDQLSALFGGRRVDLVTVRSLHPLIRDRVLDSAIVQYAA